MHLRAAHRNLSSPWVVWSVWVFAFALFSAFMPRDSGFDVMHYHLHNGWSVLNDRFGRDFAPAEMHSFLNPVYAGGVWWLIERLPGPAVSAVLAVVQSLILPVLYYLGRRLFEIAGVDSPQRAALFCAVAGFLCVPMIAVFASIRNDWMGALAYCLAMLLLLRPNPVKLRTVAVSALLVGLMVGMKLTNIVYIFGYAAFLLILAKDWAERLRWAGVAALAGIAGIALTGGWSMVHLYENFGNPVFPMMNDVFHAPLGPDEIARDDRYLPSSWFEALIVPIWGSVNLLRINEGGTRDFHLLATYLGAIWLVGYCILAARSRGTHARALVAFGLAQLAFLMAWVFAFSIMRYATAAFLLGPIMLVLAVQKSQLSAFASPGGKPFLYTMTIALVFSIGMENVRRIPWKGPLDPYVAVYRPDSLQYEDAGVIIAGPRPAAFLAHAFPETWIAHGDVQPWSARFLDNYRPLITRKIQETDGPLYAVMNVQRLPDPADRTPGMVWMEILPNMVLDDLAEEYPVTGEADDCLPLPTNVDNALSDWVICPITRTGEL